MSKPIRGKAERYLKISLFGAFFIGACAVQFIAFAKGYTPFPKWFCVFNLLVGKAVFNSVRQLGNTALVIDCTSLNEGEPITMEHLLTYGEKAEAK